MNTSRTYSAVKEQVKAKFSWKYAGGALGVAVVVLLLSLVQPWSTTAYELSDSGVWVSKGADLGRVNTQVAQMDYVGDAKGRQILADQTPEPLLVQGGRSVFLVAKDGKSIEAPQPEQPTADPKRLAVSGVKELALGGGTGNGQVVVARTESEVLLVARGGTLLPSPQSLMKVGPKSQVAVGSGGTVVAYSQQAGKKEATLQYLELSTEDVRKETLSPAPGENTTLTMIGEQVVLLDADAQQLLLPGSDPISLGALNKPEVQLPGPQSDSVVIAAEQELISVNLKSGKPTTISSDGDGTPVRPAVDADCVHGAWESVVVARCGGGTVLKKTLEPGRWYFRTGGVTALLTNPDTGNSWIVFDQNGLQKVLWPEPKEDKKESERVEETPPNRESNEKPVAKADELGARKGKVTYLNVLANDTDPNRDPILVSGEIKPDSPDGPKFSIAQGGRSIQIDTTSATEEGQTYGFTYQVSDGQLSSESVLSTVRIVPGGENNPPATLPNTDLAFDAVPNKKVNYDLLAHFIDPEGDPIILSEAKVEDPASGDKVSFDPTGFIYFTSAGKTSSVTATVQDVPPNTPGLEVSAPVQARVAAESKPPTARNDVVEVVVGSPKTVWPLLNDSDPNGDELTLVPDKIVVLPEGTLSDITVSPSSDPKSFEVNAAKPGYYSLSYKVSDGLTEPVEGRITVRASKPADASLVALTDVVIVNVGSTATVDLLANDSDARNGVLSVVDLVSPTPPEPPTPDLCSAVQLSGSVLNDFHTFQVVALEAAIETTCNFEYKITNDDGAKATAQIVVIIKPKPANTPPEFIHPEPFTVRAEQVGVIPLGAFAQDAEGDPITVSLDQKSPLPAGHGQIYQSGNDLKYVAPQVSPAEPVEVHVLISDQYTANTPLAGIVKIQVIQAPNKLPVPQDLEVRVRAGQVISIPVPLVGVDEDGTAVELTKWEPLSQAVVGKPEVDSVSQTLQFKAPPEVLSATTTKFRYFVRDTDGGEGSAIVTVQISPQDKNHSPIAVPDKVIAQKGSPIWINPVSNDTDLDGDLLKVVSSNSASPDCTAVLDGDRLKITAQSNCTIDYHVADYNPTDTKFVSPKTQPSGIVSVTVDDKYSGLRPIARDDYAQLLAGSDGKFATVNVLANDEDPDGLASDLTIDFGDDSKSISKEDSPGKVKIELKEESQRLQYSITDKQGLQAVAFVWVPRQAENRPPMESPNHAPIQAKVNAEPVTIILPEYIIDPDTGVGTDLIFSDVKSDQAENSAVLNDNVSQGMVVFKPKDAPGLGQIQVTATEKNGAKLSSTIVLAVQILPADNLPPTWIQTNPCDVQVEQDSASNPEKVKKVALLAFASDPDDLSKAGLRFSGIRELQGGVTAEVTPGGDFTASASEEARVGAGGKVAVNLTDAAGAKAEPVYCTVNVIESTELPVRVKPVTLETTQGQPLTVEIASLLEVPGKGPTFESASLQPGEGSVQESGTTLTYTSGKDFAGNANIAFTVREKRTSNGVPRTATGNIAVLVKGRPTGLTEPKANGGSLSDAKIDLAYGAANPNYDPSSVTYSVKSTSGGVAKDCGTALTCTVDAGDGVKNAIDYAFVVTAKNATGISDPSPASNVVQTDVKPSPPTDLKLTVEGDTTLSFAFTPPKPAANGMSPIIGYDCILNGSTSARVNTPTCSFPGLTNGTDYTVAAKTITAKSESEPSGTAKGNPYGAPIIKSPTLAWASAVGGMTLTASADVIDNGRAASPTWTISCSGQSGTSNPATFTCDRTAGNIVATITATNDRGPSVPTPASYQFPAEPTASISSVNSGFKQLTVNATGSGNKLQYSLDRSTWLDSNIFINVPTDDSLPVYVRACSDEWPECGKVEISKGIAYDKAPKPACVAAGGSPDSFTCDLSLVEPPLKNFTISYIVKNGTSSRGGKLRVECDQTATIYAQYEGYPDSQSEELLVGAPDVPVCVTPTTVTPPPN
ncbi:MAG: Ig-like domain-containing protein [Actinomycetes bacterium]